MPTYGGIAQAETQAGAGVTESLMTRLVNNLLAVIEADPTAPRIKLAALDEELGVLASYSTSVYHNSGTARQLGTTLNINNNTDRSLQAVVIAFRSQAGYDFVYSINGEPNYSGGGVELITLPPGLTTVSCSASREGQFQTHRFGFTVIGLATP